MMEDEAPTRIELDPEPGEILSAMLAVLYDTLEDLRAIRNSVEGIESRVDGMGSQ